MSTFGYLTTESWSGKRVTRVEVIGRTKTRLRVKLCEDQLIPHRGQCKAGTVLSVPLYAVTGREVTA